MCSIIGRNLSVWCNQGSGEDRCDNSVLVVVHGEGVCGCDDGVVETVFAAAMMVWWSGCVWL